YRASDFRPKNNIRLKHIPAANAANPQQALYLRPINPPSNQNADLNLVVHRDLNSANNFPNLGIRYMENRGERLGWNLAAGWNPGLQPPAIWNREFTWA
ncbi:hypothetical protein HDU96_007155, partial [Phlyctochytrium bullatum]